MSPTDAVPTTPAITRLIGLIAEMTGKTPADAVEAALDAYWRSELFRRTDEGYAELQADPKAWAEHLAERRAWDVTLMDGLDPNEIWLPDRTCEIREPVEAEDGKSTPG